MWGKNWWKMWGKSWNSNSWLRGNCLN
jgi:hypothetical protein